MAQEPPADAVPQIDIAWSQVFGGQAPEGAVEPYFSWAAAGRPVGFFVGRNGSGKSRVAKIIAQRAGGRLLSTDRLAGLMSFNNYGWTSVPNPEGQRGVPIGGNERQQARQFSATHGTGVDELYALREQPDVWLRVAAFIRRSLGRIVDLRVQAGFLDPHIRVGDVEYSLLRDEGHGLRELVVLLAATYRTDWTLLVVDEPELHLHPSLARLWLSEIRAECEASGRRALIVTHEPSLLRPKTVADLEAIWFFSTGKLPVNVGRVVLPQQRARVEASLQENPEIVSDLAFAPRPVLVEGLHDVTALIVSLTRTEPPEVVAQTDLVRCTGSGGVALWFEIARKLHVDVRAVADLDSLFDQAMRRAVELSPGTAEMIREELKINPATITEALRPLHQRMHSESVDANPRAKADWLAALTDDGDGDTARRDALLRIFRAAGIWLHPQGRLEQVLGIEDKGGEQARLAAAKSGPIDDVASWCAYKLDPAGEVRLLLDLAVEEIAHNVMEALRTDPTAAFSAPIGPSSEIDSRLVEIAHVALGRHRITVKVPQEFAGLWLEFSRDTPASALQLNEP